MDNKAHCVCNIFFLLEKNSFSFFSLFLFFEKYGCYLLSVYLENIIFFYFSNFCISAALSIDYISI